MSGDSGGEGGVYRRRTYSVTSYKVYQNFWGVRTPTTPTVAAPLLFLSGTCGASFSCLYAWPCWYSASVVRDTDSCPLTASVLRCPPRLGRIEVGMLESRRLEANRLEADDGLLAFFEVAAPPFW